MTTRIYFLMFLYLEYLMSLNQISLKLSFTIIKVLYYLPALYNAYYSIYFVDYTLAYYMFEFVYLLKYHLPINKNNITHYIFTTLSMILFSHVLKVGAAGSWLIIWNISCRNLLTDL